MKFSVVVPVYNVEPFIDGAIESVIKQDYTDWEMILIDDGSVDSSRSKCDEWARKDKRIQAIHKSNGGASSARNVGILTASGDYIVFLDGDDELVEGALEKLAHEILVSDYPDIAICNFYHWVDGKLYIVVDNKLYNPNGEESLLNVCEKFARDNVQMPWRPYQGVVNTQFLRNRGILFNEEIAAAEDCDFFLRLVPHVRSYLILSLPLVKYRAFRTGSLINEQKFLPVYGQLQAFCIASDEYSESFSNVSLMKRYFADKYTNIIILVEQIAAEKDKKICYDFVREHRNILKRTSRKPKYAVSKFVWNIFGFERGNKILMLLKRLERK